MDHPGASERAYRAQDWAISEYLISILKLFGGISQHTILKYLLVNR